MTIKRATGAETSDLADFFPAGVVGLISLSPTLGPLHAEEAAAARSFAAARLREFRHGRDCARAALSRLGAEAGAIPIGKNRQPVWPHGVVGSISHCGQAAAAAAAWEADIAGLGIDIELDRPLEEALIPRICTAAELATIERRGQNPGQLAMRLFCIKEATYKAIWPLRQRFLDFQDLDVVLDPTTDRFIASSGTEACPAELLSRLSGCCKTRGELVISAVTIRHQSQAPGVDQAERP